MLKVKLRFEFEQEVDNLTGEFFDSAVECLQMMKRMHELGIAPRSCQVGDYTKEVYGYIDVTPLSSEE
jgi:hypothetical protein